MQESAVSQTMRRKSSLAVMGNVTSETEDEDEMGYSVSDHSINEGYSSTTIDDDVINFERNISILRDMDITHDKSIVAALDFGTTYSGYAYCDRIEYTRDPNKITLNEWTGHKVQFPTAKAPTTVLFDSKKRFHSFGYKAETQYAKLTEEKRHNEWYCFRRFKMQLYETKELGIDLCLKDLDGKEMPAIDIFSAAIRYMKEHLMEAIAKRYGRFQLEAILFVITIPAIWRESAKQFMREAAIQAGIPDDQLMFALEPEAAALYCKTLPEHSLFGSGVDRLQSCFSPGGRYMILDLGGGTVDTAVHEVRSDGSLVEIYKATGGPWGGTTVDDEFHRYMKQEYGPDSLEKLREDSPRDLLDLDMDFETQKRQITKEDEDDIRLRIPGKLAQISLGMDKEEEVLNFETNVQTQKLSYDLVNNNSTCSTLRSNRVSFSTLPDAEKPEDSKTETMSSFPKRRVRKQSLFHFYIDQEDFRRFFQPSVEHIKSHVSKILEEVGEVDLILMVGGFSDSDLVKQKLEKIFTHIRVVVPKEASMAVMKGAVLFGFRPSTIYARKCRYTYGIKVFTEFREGDHPQEKLRVIDGEKKCDDVFNVLVREGDVIKINEARCVNLTSSHCEETSRFIRLQTSIYASTNPEPKFTTDEGCSLIGTVTNEPPPCGWSDHVHFRTYVYFGRTELRVLDHDETHGRGYFQKFSLLGDEPVTFRC